MLKTLEKNWMTIRGRSYFKRFAEWVTSSTTNKDILLRTRLKLALLYVFFVGVLLILLGVGVLERSVPLIMAIPVAAIIVSYFLTTVALKPVKETLESQRRFISDASHELRTPLSIIRTNSELPLLDEEELSKDEIIDVMRSNLEEADRMSHIISNLFDLATLNQKTERPFFHKVDVYSLAQNVVTRAQDLARRKKIKLDCHGSPSTFMWGNETALDELIWNLLKNAISYTPNDGKVMVSVTEQDANTLLAIKERHVIIEVQDTGVGINQEELSQVFTPFYRSKDTNHDDPYTGDHGLGLSICRKIVASHNGTIDITNNKHQSGVTVVVSLPTRV